MIISPNNLYLGDCLELMHGIPDQSIDMILADLPYGTTACHWDSIIPLDPLWAHYKRIIKPKGAIVLTASQPFTSVLVMSNLDWFRYEWIWEKLRGTGYLSANKAPMKNHENIVVFCRESSIYNPQMRNGESPYTSTSFSVGGTIEDKTVGGWITKNDGTRYPLTVNKFNGVNNTKTIHPTQKPVALFAYLIQTYTNPGNVVLDNVIGSGTTAIAAIETGRQWIGIEQDPDYFRIAQDRIAERLKQPFLPGLDSSEPPKYKQNGFSIPDTLEAAGSVDN